MALLLSEPDCERLLSMADAVRAVREVYELAGKGQVDATPRRTAGKALEGNTKTLKSVTAASVELDALAAHLYTTGTRGSEPEDTKKVYGLFRLSTGALTAIISGNLVSWLKTGAVGAVAAEAMARPDARCLGVIGAGRQGAAAVAGMLEVLPIEQVRVFSRDRETRDRFVERQRAAHGERAGAPEFIAATSAEEVARAADVLVTTTTSKEPVIEREWLPDGCHVNAMGAHAPGAREIDAATVAAARVAVDLRPQALEEKGEILIPWREGTLPVDPATYPELGEIVAGSAQARADDRELTLFCSGGTGLETLAVACAVWEASGKTGGVGTELNLREGPKA